MLTEIQARLPEGRRVVSSLFDDFFEPDRTAVISIDMIKSHLGHPTDCPCPGGERGIEKIEPTNAFHREARRLGVPIIHCRSFLRPGDVDDPRENRATWRRLLEWGGDTPPLLDQHVVDGTEWVDFVTEVEEGDLIVNKKRMSAFVATDLDFILRNKGITTVVIDGIFIDACDLSTAFHAADRDYKVIAVGDIVPGSSDEMTAAALNIIATYIGLVVDAGDLVAEWEARRQEAGA